MSALFKCPSCHQPWDILRNDTCQCGAQLVKKDKAIQPPTPSTLSPEIADGGDDPLSMILEFENYGDTLKLHCPNENNEFAIIVKNKGARHAMVYGLTLDETDLIVSFLSCHIHNARMEPAQPMETSATEEIPADVQKWMAYEKGMIHGSAEMNGAIAMYHKMQEASTSKIHSIWNHIANELEGQLSEVTNDRNVFKEWWDTAKADIATLTEQRDANAQKALSYMERLTEAETALVKIGMLTNGVFEKGEEEEIKKS